MQLTPTQAAPAVLSTADATTAEDLAAVNGPESGRGVSGEQVGVAIGEVTSADEEDIEEEPAAKKNKATDKAEAEEIVE